MSYQRGYMSLMVLGCMGVIMAVFGFFVYGVHHFKTLESRLFDYYQVRLLAAIGVELFRENHALYSVSDSSLNLSELCGSFSDGVILDSERRISVVKYSNAFAVSGQYRDSCYVLEGNYQLDGQDLLLLSIEHPVE